MINDKYDDVSNKKKHIVVLGDIILDEFIYGNQIRKSAEAPINIFDEVASSYNLGGAANVAANVVSMGMYCTLIGVLGEENDIIKKLLHERNIDANYILKSRDRITTHKRRYIIDNHQIFRSDKETTLPINKENTQLIVNNLIEVHQKKAIDFLILQDYNKGVLHVDNIDIFLKFAHQHNIPVAVDPKFSGFLAYNNIAIFKPNRKEFIEALSLSEDISIDQLILQAEKYRINKNIQHLIITLSQQGLLSICNENTTYCKGIYVEHPDVCGAGDSLIVVSVWASIQGYATSHTAELMNLAGSIICNQKGINTIKLEDILNN
jgi:rfaE bifunctional protein kinase chain/domain